MFVVILNVKLSLRTQLIYSRILSYLKSSLETISVQTLKLTPISEEVLLVSLKYLKKNY